MTRKQALRMAADAKRRRQRQFMMKRPRFLMGQSPAQMAMGSIMYSTPTGRQNWVREMFIGKHGAAFAKAFDLSVDFEDKTPWP